MKDKMRVRQMTIVLNLAIPFQRRRAGGRDSR